MFSVIEKLFICGVVLIPFTGIAGIGGLGELQHMASAYLFIAALGVAVFPFLDYVGNRIGGARKSPAVFGIPYLMFIMITVIVLSFAANFPMIRVSSFQGRSGLEKFTSSTILVVFGFLLAYLTYYLSGRRSWDRLIVWPICLSVVICALFSFFEIGGQYNGGLAAIHGALSGLIHEATGALEWDTRLRSVAFEPPDFANAAGYIWPWLVGGMMASDGWKRLSFISLWVVLNVMIVLSGARTNLVVITGLVATFVLLRLVFLPKRELQDPEKHIAPLTLIMALVLPSLLIAIHFWYSQIVTSVVTGDNVSNLSRLASMAAAVRMFEAHPFLGFGFGQFGFHCTEFMPSWGFKSWEIQLWLFGPMGFWPAVYSVYARFGADMGVPGIVMWAGIWLWLAHAVLVATIRHRKRTGEIPFAAYPLVMSCICVLLAGVPSDSVRSPMIWINMGLACRYLFEMRVMRAKALAAQEERNA